MNLLLKGLIEPSKEIAKLQKKIEFLSATRDKLDKAMSATDYVNKVPEEVQKSNVEKLDQTVVEIMRLEKAIEVLSLMG